MNEPQNPKSPDRAPTRREQEVQHLTASAIRLRMLAESYRPDAPSGCERLHKPGWIDQFLFARVRGMDGRSLDREIQRALGRGRLADAEVLMEEKRRRWLWVTAPYRTSGGAA